ncbi:MAG: hypothetical protein AB7S26_22770 [Sandaracinaceae bacterium]
MPSLEPSEILGRAAIQCGGLPGAQLSLPTLVQVGGAVEMGMLIYRSQLVRGIGSVALRATHVARFSLDDGELIELRALPIPESNEPLGPLRRPVALGEDEIEAERVELMRELLELAPELRKRSTEHVGARHRVLLRYERLCPTVLRPLLSGIAPEMFAWLEAARRV